MRDSAPTDAATRLRQLAKISGPPSPVVSVYLNTRWADEHQRDRVRLFLASELRKARSATVDPGLASDLQWIETQGTALVEQRIVPDGDGVALFACHSVGLREMLPVRISPENSFVVAEAPYLTPLATHLVDAPSAVIAFVDTEHARLIPLGPGGPGEEVELRGEVPGRHSRGGWAQLAQSRYQRHVQVHRDQHLEAVAHAVGRLAEEGGAERIVLAGDARLVAALRSHLPASLAGRVVGSVSAARYEPAAALASRATEMLAHARAEQTRAAVDAILTEAAKGGRAVAGPEATLDAALRGAVHGLYALRTFRESGRRCAACKTLQRGVAARCGRCGGDTGEVELGAALVDRVLAAGGQVEILEAHEGLAGRGGVAARLRYPL
jgi:peptide subunit release factor 1 (eRF1)